MKGNRLLFILLGLLVIVLLYFNVASKIEVKEQYELLKEEKALARERVEVMLNSVNQSSEVYKSYFINQEEILEGITYPVLIYRYPEGMCSPCFQEDMESLYKLQDNWTKDKILILPAYGDDRSSQLAMQSELNKFNFKNISQSIFSIPFNEAANTEDRYFGVINEKGELEMLFFPKLGYSELTRLYLRKAKARVEEE